MRMSASDRAVWLQTTCLWNAASKEDASHHDENTNSSSSSSIAHAWNKILSTAFFRCNIVVASMNEPRVLDLSDSQILPCGDDNLLLLQNLQSDNAGNGLSTFQMLLSECYMIPLSYGDASRLSSSNDDGKHGGNVEGWQVDVSPSTFHWIDRHFFHQETVRFNLTNAFKTFRLSRSSHERKQPAADPTYFRTSKFQVTEPYRIGTSSPSLEGMCSKDDVQSKHATAENNREAWEALLKQSIENELRQIDLVLIVLAVIAFVFSMFFIWEVIGYSRKYSKNLKQSFRFSVSPVPSSIAPESSTPTCKKSCEETTSIGGVVAAPTTLDISPLSLDTVFASSQVDRVRKHQVNPEEAPEETPFQIKKFLRPTMNSKRHLTPAIVSPEREQYLPSSFTSSTTRPPTFLPHGEQQKQQLKQQQQQQQLTAPVPRTVFAKCYRPSEGRFILRPIPITPPPPPPSAPRNEPSSNHGVNNNNHEAPSTLARRRPCLETAAGASFVHDYWCD